MPRSDLQWRSDLEPVAEARIAEVQKNLGLRFPDSFLECVRRSNGGCPEPRCFSYFHSQWNEQEEGSFGALLDFREPMDRHLKQIFRDDPDLWKDMNIQAWWMIEDRNLLERPTHFTPGLVAFSEDGGGNYLCFDYRADKRHPDPAVVLWEHEFHSGSEEPFFVAKNFNAVLELLRPCEFNLAQLNAQ